MKKVILFFTLSFLVFFEIQAQNERSPHHLEFSFGVEAFETFVPRVSDVFTDIGFDIFVTGDREPLPGDLRWRTVGSVSYKKTQESGNYFGFLVTYGQSNWIEEEQELVLDVTGTLTSENFLEENKEGTIGYAYVYSFLLTKESPNLRFYLGGESSVYDNFTDVTPIDVNNNGLPRRNIFGIRIAAVPELSYFFPNSPVTASLRAKLPLLHFERNASQGQVPGFSSFFGGFTVDNSFDALVMNRVRFELGIGYFFEVL